MNSQLLAVIIVILTFSLVAALVFVMILIACRRRRKTAAVDQEQPIPDEDPVDFFDPSLKASKQEVVAATKSFSADQIIDKSSFATIYKAKLSCGRTLAVKKLNATTSQDCAEFQSELDVLGRLQHPNILQLLGYCVSGADKFLVYDFFERGSLYSSIIRGDLSWEERVKAVRGVAVGLEHMHHGSNKSILHRNVNPKAVLLGQDFEARLDDFGLARIVEWSRTHVSTYPVGLEGYMPPEYLGFGEATTKGDVYSFGVLMLDVAAPVSAHDEPKGLVSWARERDSTGRVVEMLDPRCDRGSALENSKVEEYFRIALKCVKQIPKERPTMRDIVKWLKELS